MIKTLKRIQAMLSSRSFWEGVADGFSAPALLYAPADGGSYFDPADVRIRRAHQTAGRYLRMEYDRERLHYGAQANGHGHVSTPKAIAP